MDIKKQSGSLVQDREKEFGWRKYAYFYLKVFHNTGKFLIKYNYVEISNIFCS